MTGKMTQTGTYSAALDEAAPGVFSTLWQNVFDVIETGSVHAI